MSDRSLNKMVDEFIRRHPDGYKGPRDLPYFPAKKKKPSRKAKRIKQSLATAPDQVFDPAEEDLDTIIDCSDLYEVDGVVQICVHCDADLTTEDVKQDLKRCKKNSWAEPEPDDGFVCQKKDCKRYRADEAARVAEVKKEDDERELVREGKRQTEDGLVYEEKPCDEGLESIIPIASDFLDDETPPLVRVRAGHTLPPTNGPIKLPGVDFFPTKPCTAHGVDACTDCFSAAALTRAFEEQREKGRLLMAAAPNQAPSSIEDDVKKLLEKKKIARLAKRPPEPSVVVRRNKEQGWVRKAYDNHSLRRLHGYAVRQLADLFDSPRFNPSPANSGGNPKTAPVFTPGQVAFYRDYARGKTSKEVLEARVANGWYGRKGFERPDYLKKLEDDLVNRAWLVGLLEPTPVVIPGAENNDDPFAPDTAVEDAMMRNGGTGGLSIIGAKYKSSPGKTFKTYAHNSFEQGVVTRRVSGDGGSGGDSGRGPDYGESSDDEAD